jgi:hypothetical protein
MAIAQNIFKQVRIKKEVTWATAPGATSARLLRRVSSDLKLVKNSYGSNEVRADQQKATFRHGTRRVEGGINGELSCGTYYDLMAAAVRKDFAAVTTITGMSITIAGSGPTYTVTRSAGDFLAGGIKQGMVVALTAGTFNVNNLNKRLFVVNVTATVLTVIPAGNGTMTAEGPIASASLAVPGKYTYMPATGHTNDSFYIEHWFSDVAVSHRYAGCRVNTMALALPPSGLNTVQFGFLGKDRTRDTTAYYTTPTAESANDSTAAISGVLYLNGSADATLTNLSLNVNNNRSVAEVVGSNVTPEVFAGPMDVTGNLTALFENDTIQALLDNESEFSILGCFWQSSDATSEAMTFALPRVKLAGADLDDGAQLNQSCELTALIPSTGGSGIQWEKTTLMIQDTLAP